MTPVLIAVARMWAFQCTVPAPAVALVIMVWNWISAVHPASRTEPRTWRGWSRGIAARGGERNDESSDGNHVQTPADASLE